MSNNLLILIIFILSLSYISSQNHSLEYKDGCNCQGPKAFGTKLDVN